MQTEIFEYIKRRKNGKNNKVGVILGMVDGETIKIGWSKCNFIKGDKFDVKQGIQLAKNRAKNESAVNAPIPECIKHQARQFSARCVRYFKNAKQIELPA